MRLIHLYNPIRFIRIHFKELIPDIIEFEITENSKKFNFQLFFRLDQKGFQI